MQQLSQSMGGMGGMGGFPGGGFPPMGPGGNMPDMVSSFPNCNQLVVLRKKYEC